MNVTLALFSTYPSELLAVTCDKEVAEKACIEDRIPPDAFAASLAAQDWFAHFTPFEEGADYELLIANLASPPITSDKGNFEQHFTEMTLHWRGIEIDSHVIPNQTLVSLADIEKARTQLSLWYADAIDRNVFSAEFLYHVLHASDYANKLSVPETLGEFNRLDTQLYADPFKGSITRYTHPYYEDALVDVTVYPILAKLDDNTDSVLQQQLLADWNKADQVARSRNLTLTQPSPVSVFSVDSNTTGWRLGLKAESVSDAAIFATTYVFKRSDKIIKVATTFPTDFSDELANELITRISVPDESELMQQVRATLE